MINAWWFNNKQCASDVLQPDFFTPKTQLRLYAELPSVEYPININILAQYEGATVFTKSYVIESAEAETNFKYDIFAQTGVITLSDFADTLENSPDCIDVEICTGEHKHTQSIACEYAVISGKITDFESNPFPAAVVYNLHTFEGLSGDIGVWSDESGNYTLTLPKGEYHSIFVDDNTYAQSSLEAWGWKMIVDCDEVHDYKIGNGEVYSLDVWTNNGGFPTLFMYFRPMILSYAMKQNVNSAEVNGKQYSVYDTCPEIELHNISVAINGSKADNISLQKIIETGQDGSAMPAYILQVERPSAIGKQTVVVEYNFMDAHGEPMQSQGRTQFNFTSAYGLVLR